MLRLRLELCFNVNSKTLLLLKRNLSRAQDEHVGELLTVMNDAISIIHPTRRVTVSESLKLFQEKTLGALKDYIAKIRMAILTVIENTNVKFSEDDKATVLALVKKHVEPSLYSTRFVAFESAFSRHVARFGSPFQLSDFRVDLTKALYEADVANSIRKFVDALSDDLEIIAQRQENIIRSKSEDNWYEKPIGKIGIGLFVAIIAALAIYLINTHTGLQL